MTFTFQLDKNEYKKDYIRYFLYKKRLHIFTALAIILVLTILYLWSWFFDGIALFNKHQTLIAMTSIVFVLVIFTDLLSYSRAIIKSAGELPLSPQKISFKESIIKIELDGESLELFYSDFKEMKFISDTLFLVLKDKFEWPIRINNKEIGENGTSKILKLMNQKLV